MAGHGLGYGGHGHIPSLAKLEVDLSEGKDKWSHLAAYGGQMWRFSQLYARRVRVALAFVAMGVGLEILQGFTGYRSYDVNDMLAIALA